jgi:hypothetical protein
MCKIKDTIIEKQDTGVDKYGPVVEPKCIGCDSKRGEATRCNNTLCQECWYDAEGNG